MQLKASAPGSLMLLGEFAVLQGKQALVCAVDKRLSVTLTPRTDTRIEITSSALGHLSIDLSQLEIVKPFQFVLAALQTFQHQLQQGCDIQIESEFSDKIGFGSSAAVTVATLAALMHWLNIPYSSLELVSRGRDVVRHVQGIGSGADIAASVYGGVVSYNAKSLSVEKISVTLPLNAIYAGYKTPTVDVIQHVQNQFANNHTALHDIYDNIGQCSLQAVNFVRDSDWIKLGDSMNEQQAMMESLGVSSPLLSGMVEDLRLHPGIFGAKISGSGMGDCVIGLGELPESYQCLIQGQLMQRIPVATTLQGVYCEKI
jgi:mevalonate kinase